MKFAPRPEYSKHKINQAGRLLTTLDPNTKEYQEALGIVNQWRACHAYPLNTFKTTLRLKAKKYEGSLVAQRLKRLPTIVDKLQRLPTMKLTQMQDIGGARVVVAGVKEVKQLQAEYKQNGRFSHELKDEDDYIEKPKPDGYRGVHLIYRYNNTLARNAQAEKYKGLYIELQIRSYLQHTWATAVETVGTLKNESIKTGKGNREWREFFELISSAFAVIEGSSVLPQHSGMTAGQIFKKIKKYQEKLNLHDNLTGLAAAVTYMNNTSSNGYYNIIELNIPNKKASIISFAKDDLQTATDTYAAMEKDAGSDTDIVLVSAGDLKSLKKAYPNYFLDVNKFIKLVQIIIDEA